MKKFKCIFMTIFFILIAGSAQSGPLSNMWGELIKKYPPPEPTIEERKSLASIYAPLIKKYPYPEKLFLKKKVKLEEIERKAAPYIRHHKQSPQKTALCQKRLKPYQKTIHRASINFDVPEQIIGAVILQESSGNPRAKAKTSSAKGLMQTINSTFAFAKKNLKKLGITISDPYKPEDSIYAGAWYLSYVFELAKQDWPKFNDRKKIEMWEKALEYYYAGPTWGKNPKPIFHAYINGKKIVIKKAYYSRKVLEYAFIL
ncbi:putative Transglycosylase SLT domain-containing protein [Candidatus Magnetomoraceae bacterium gMMP-1]